VLYNVKVGRGSKDLFVASDRANDTLAIYAIDPTRAC
jgi:myo-inositol-hexaphosphate 3-phosphohydrolase